MANVPGDEAHVDPAELAVARRRAAPLPNRSRSWAAFSHGHQNRPACRPLHLCVENPPCRGCADRGGCGRWTQAISPRDQQADLSVDRTATHGPAPGRCRGQQADGQELQPNQPTSVRQASQAESQGRPGRPAARSCPASLRSRVNSKRYSTNGGGQAHRRESVLGLHEIPVEELRFGSV